ncbi:MAG TPA: hypothetical protein DHW82_01370 [Spirochaetia bacterium]|nr:MAG: hypothetical protein A2Y41_13640 [Spirochaetes bacterium GWB1_36_13]HCL55647.1 hypothetical protein [Spirochaetia bacterium]
MVLMKEEAKKLIDTLPDDADWEDLMYEIYVREKIEKGLKAIKENQVLNEDEAKKRLLGHDNSMD